MVFGQCIRGAVAFPHRATQSEPIDRKPFDMETWRKIGATVETAAVGAETGHGREVVIGLVGVLHIYTGCVLGRGG